MFGLSAGAAAAVIGGTTLAGAAISANAAKSAASQQARAIQQGTDASVSAQGNAIDEQRRQFDVTNQLYAPYRSIGLGALNKLSDTSNNFDSAAYLRNNPDVAGFQEYRDNPLLHYQQYGQAEGRQATPYNGFQSSPDYAFRRSEGLRGIEQTNAARGVGRGGNALKALAEFNSNLASGEFGNWWNRQAGLAGVGQAATGATANAGQQMATNVGNAFGSIGNTLYQGAAGVGDARASGVMGAANTWSNGLNSALNTGLLYRGGYFNKR